jgi:hypothetical protein
MPSLQTRLGVKLTPLKAWIFDRIDRSGSSGIEGDALWERLCVVAPRKKNRKTLKVHIHQINNALRASEYRIVCERGNAPVYRVMRPSPRRISS